MSLKQKVADNPLAGGEAASKTAKPKDAAPNAEAALSELEAAIEAEKKAAAEAQKKKEKPRNSGGCCGYSW